MKYRTRLYLLFTLLVLCTSSIGMTVVYWQARELLLTELRSKVMTIAVTMAGLIDGDQLRQVQGPQDMGSEAFGKIAADMKEIRNANRRDDVYVFYLYTMRPTADPEMYELGIDVDDAKPDVYIYTGKPYPEAKKLRLHEKRNTVWATDDVYTDNFGTFLSGYAPIVDANGQYVATLGVDLTAGYVQTQLARMKTIIWITLLAAFGGALVIATFLVRFATRSLDAVCACVERIGKGDLTARVYLKTHDEFGRLAEAVNRMAIGIEENQRLKLNFVRYVSRHVMEKILASDVPLNLTGERRKITVLFSDIRQFTHLAEHLSPEQVVSLLNEYLDRMLNVIFDHNGTLDKFIGDGLMVEFGAPLDDPEQEKHAVDTAIAMQKALQDLNRKWAAENRPQLAMGVGIHTGPAVIGNIGSEKRMEYTAIGDTVNIASRLEHATKEFKVKVLISESTQEKIGPAYKVKNLGPLSLPGRDTPIGVFALEVEE